MSLVNHVLTFILCSIPFNIQIASFAFLSDKPSPTSCLSQLTKLLKNTFGIVPHDILSSSITKFLTFLCEFNQSAMSSPLPLPGVESNPHKSFFSSSMMFGNSCLMPTVSITMPGIPSLDSSSTLQSLDGSSGISFITRHDDETTM